MTVLFVCHANLCRSPMAERLARQAVVASTVDIEVTSAGTHAREGLPMHPQSAAALREVGADPEAFRSRTLTAEQLHAADLVLTADRAQRSICAGLAPAALPRIFTIRQFGRLVEAVDSRRVVGSGPRARLASLLDEIRVARAENGPVPPHEDDLPDPLNGTHADFTACREQIGGALLPALALVTES